MCNHLVNDTLMKVFTSKTQKTGELGENIATEYLVSKGFLIIERNYTKKWGELDIIAKKADVLHLIEVKSVSCESFYEDSHRPEDNMGPIKIARLRRVIRSCLLNFGEVEWQFDLICVYLDHSKRHAQIKIIRDIIL